jgi:UDP-N-acetylglucosamine 4,6-dehydratase
MEWTKKSILITGGTGSFGRNFIKVIQDQFQIERLIVYSRDELKQHQMRSDGFNQENLRYFIGNVRDLPRLKRAMEGVDVVIHAAALKQVPACEYNPMEAVKTNILGTSNVIDAALDVGVEKVLALSTDKAVNPINLYGATKLSAEKLVVQSNAYAGGKSTRLSCVRYGNVVGSRGSVVPVFIRQRNHNNKLTITDRRMTRFWITLDQAVNFVIRVIEMMEGGEVFVPKIPSMKIMDLARAVAPDADVEVIGIRPGEKLHEVLISRDEARATVELDDMYVVQPLETFWFGGSWDEDGKLVEEGFKYSSDNNQSWLAQDDIKSMIKPFEQSNP